MLDKKLYKSFSNDIKNILNQEIRRIQTLSDELAIIEREDKMLEGTKFIRLIENARNQILCKSD